MNKSNDPLHGITLAFMLQYLVTELGWVEMGKIVNINCFNSSPSIKSSLTFLRKTPWARTKVEALFLSVYRPTDL